MSIPFNLTDWAAETIPHTPAIRSGSSTPQLEPATEELQESASEIPSAYKINYITSSLFLKKARQAARECLQTEMVVRLVILDCTDVAIIDKDLEKIRYRVKIRIWHDTDSIIIKFMPSAAHEVTAGLFIDGIKAELLKIPASGKWPIISLGSTRFRSGNKGKEPDGSLRCSSRTSGDWPNVVLEVGYSESVTMLHHDAHWWLRSSTGRTKLVIIIHISKNPNKILIELWEMGINPNRRTRVSTSLVPVCINTINIDANKTVTLPTGTITIPYNSLFDATNAQGAPVIFTTADLSNYAGLVYANIL